jgi:TPR repeat protein
MKTFILAFSLSIISMHASACMIGDHDGCLKEAIEGDPKAQTGLAFMYVKGRGVDKNDTKALKWYRLAAKQNNAFAQLEIGIMYMEGRAVQKDYEEAIKWFRLSAEQGYAGAQRMLGTMYMRGHGVTQSDAEALNWSALADAQGNDRLQFILCFFAFLVSFLVSSPLTKLLGRRQYAAYLLMSLGGLLAYINNNPMFFGSIFLAVIMTEVTMRAKNRTAAILSKPLG